MVYEFFLLLLRESRPEIQKVANTRKNLLDIVSSHINSVNLIYGSPYLDKDKGSTLNIHQGSFENNKKKL